MSKPYWAINLRAEVSVLAASYAVCRSSVGDWWQEERAWVGRQKSVVLMRAMINIVVTKDITDKTKLI